MKQAMIFAAGLGTRLKPLTDTMPKALVRVGGEPLLKHVVLGLRDAGFERIVVNVHHFASQIVTYLEQNNNFGLDIRISDETGGLLDTGGGIKRAAALFDRRYPILIHNVDILSNVNLARFYTLDEKVMCPGCGVPHLMTGARLLVSWRKTRRYLVFNKDMQLVGWVNVETGEIRTPYDEVRAELETVAYPYTVGDTPKPITEHLLIYAFSGIHVFYPRMFPLMDGCPEKFPILDFYLRNCKKIPIQGVVKDNLQLMDVGKLDTLHDADAFLQRLKQNI